MENEERQPPADALLTEIAATLKTIKEWITFIGVVVIFGLLAVFVYVVMIIIRVKGGP